MKRFLLIVLIASVLSISNIVNINNQYTVLRVSAATTIESGKCGSQVTWSLSSDGTLTISGSGNMTNYQYPGATSNKSPFYSFKNKIKTVVIKSGVTSVGDNAFSGCNNITSITVPSTVTKIGKLAFEDCTSLKTITLSKGLISIGHGAFDSCSALTSITIPSGVTSIGDWAFSGCSNLTSITIPTSVTKIGDLAFENCSKLKSIKIPSGVKTIGIGAFFFCSSLTSVTIPSSVTSIGVYAFDGCKNPTLTISNNDYAVKYAKNNGIKYVVNITSVKLNKTSATVKKGKTLTLTATINPSNTTNSKTLKWTSSNTKVATVSSKGVVSGKAVGTTTITVTTSNGKTATCKVTVPYTITYQLNSGKNHSSNPSTYYGKKITLKNPTRKGYTFKGWYSDSKFKKKVTSFSSGNQTLYAKWAKVSVAKAKTPSLTNVKGKKLKISYSATSGAKGYQIQYSTSKNFKTKTTKTVTAKSKTYTLSKGNTYYVRVRAYKLDSTGAKVYGSWSAVKSKKITK